MASYVISTDELFVTQMPVLIIVGAIFSSLLFFFKPVDNFIILLLHIRGRQRSARYFVSPLLEDERAKINGAVMISVSLLFASRLLSIVNLNISFEILLLISTLITVAGIYEALQVILAKIPLIEKYENQIFWGTIPKNFKEAMDGKKWRLAKILSYNIDNEKSDADELLSKISEPYKQGGFCPECGHFTNRQGARTCSNCGELLITYCNNCKEKYSIIRYVVTKDTKKTPKYCDFCGEPLI